MINRAVKYLKLDILIRPFKPIGGWFFRVFPNMITCREFNDLIYDHVEGTLSEKEALLAKRHLRVCPLCRNFLRTYTAAHQAKTHFFPFENIDTPDKVPQDLIDAILDVQSNNERLNDS